jgi:HK97 family phage prohead protease
MIDKFKQIKAKNLSLKLSDIDTTTRTVVGYFAAFDTLDSDGDVFRKGSFSKSLKEKGVNATGNRRIAHLWNHNWDVPIGRLIELEEDNYGLRFTSQLSRSQKGMDVLADYQDGIIREHSVGFYYLSNGTHLRNDFEFGMYNELADVDLLEGSSVVYGSNSLTPVIDVTKGMSEIDLIADLNEQMTTYLEALKNGAGSDERLYQIEMGLKTIQSSYLEILNRKQTTNIVEPAVKSERSTYNKFLLNLLKK